METSNVCNHRLHDNKIISCKDYYYGDKKIIKVMNKWFILYGNVLLFIVDCENLLNACPRCKVSYYLYIYGQFSNFRASFDGVTDLPMQTYNYNIEKFILFTPYSEPSFGTFLHSFIGIDKNEMSGQIILYCLSGKLAKIYSSPHVTLDNKTIVCCALGGKIVFINENGEIITPEISYSGLELPITFKIGNCSLVGDCRYIFQMDYGDVNWTYNNLALKTKPAIAFD